MNTIEEAIEAIRLGEMIVVVDDEDRENEGDLLMAAEFADHAAVNFMAKYGRGLICMPMEQGKLDILGLEPMISDSSDPKETAFTVSVDYKDLHTGISAGERAETIKRLIEPGAKGNDFTKPGHMFPLAAKDGGVLVRNGHTEAAVDLARMAGLEPAGVICEIMNEDGTMARMDDLEVFSREHGLKMITIEDLIAYRKTQESVLEKVSEIQMPTKHGDFRLITYVHKYFDEHHLALVKGDVSDSDNILIRVHSECLTGEVLGSLRCDCGDQLDAAMAAIEAEGKGILIYLRQEGRGIGLVNKIKAYALQDQGADTVDANLMLGLPEEMREYDVAAHMLRELDISSVRVMTNNPEKIEGLEANGIEVTERIAIQMNHHERNEKYLRTKQERMGHLLMI